MDPIYRLLLALFLALLISPATAFNITRLLDQHSEFSTFNSMLSQTGVAEAVNSRQTITVLAVDNGAAGGLNGRARTVMRNVMATHIILDYYDEEKLGELSKNESALLTTLFQSSGQASGQRGFLNVTVSKGGIVFGSAAHGAQHNAQLVKVVASQPFNISVLQVSSLIDTPGIDDQGGQGAPMTAPSPRRMGPTSSSPSSSSAPSSDSAAADFPADDSSSPADSPAADSAPGSAPAPGPAADDAADKLKNMAAGQARTGGLFVALVAALVVGL